MKVYCLLLLYLLTIVTSASVDATVIRVRPRHHLPSHHTDLEKLEEEQDNEHLSASDAEKTLSKNIETIQEQIKDEEANLEDENTQSQKTEESDVQSSEEHVSSLDQQHDSDKLVITEKDVFLQSQNEQTNQTQLVIKTFEDDNVEYENETSVDVQDKSNNKIQKEEELVVLEQDKLTLTEEQEQTNDTATEKQAKTKDTVTEKPEQTSDKVTEEPKQTHDTAAEEPEQTHDTGTEEQEQTYDTVTEEQEQKTNQIDILEEKAEQVGNTEHPVENNSEKENNVSSEDTLEPGVETERHEVPQNVSEGNTEKLDEGGSLTIQQGQNEEGYEDLEKEKEVDPETNVEEQKVLQDIEKDNFLKPEAQDVSDTQREENLKKEELEKESTNKPEVEETEIDNRDRSQVSDDLKEVNTDNPKEAKYPEKDNENNTVGTDLAKNSGNTSEVIHSSLDRENEENLEEKDGHENENFQLPEKGDGYEKNNTEIFKEMETPNQENMNSHDPEEVTKEDVENSSLVENKSPSDQLDTKSQTDNGEKPTAIEDHTESDNLNEKYDENDNKREPEEQINELTEPVSSEQQTEVNFQENTDDGLQNDIDSNTEKKQNQGLENDDELAPPTEQEQLVLEESSTKDNLDTNNKEIQETEEESFIAKESNKDETEEEELDENLEEVHDDQILEDEVYPILPGTIHIFEQQLPELNRALTEYLRGAIFMLGDKMKSGIEELDIPVLDPLPLPDRNIFPVIGGETFDTQFREVVIKGLSNFRIQEIDANLRSLRVRLTIHFPQVYAECSFKANGTLFDVFTVTGNGQMIVEFNDIFARTMIYLKREDGKVRVHIADHPYVEFSVARVKLHKTRENRQLGYSGLSSQLAPILFWIFTEDIVEKIDYYLAKYINFSLEKFGFPDYFFDLPPYQRHLRIALTKPIPYNFVSPYFNLAYGLSRYRI